MAVAVARGSARPRVSRVPDLVESSVRYVIEPARKLDELFNQWLTVDGTVKFVELALESVQTRGPMPHVGGRMAVSPSRTSTPPRNPSRSPNDNLMGMSSTLTSSAFLGSGTFQRLKSNENELPRLYFRDPPAGETCEPWADDGALWTALAELVRNTGGRGLRKDEHMEAVASLLGLTKYTAGLLYAQLDPSGIGLVSGEVLHAHFKRAWQGRSANRRFFDLLLPSGARTLTGRDFLGLMQTIVSTHGGLSFLRETPEFQARYCESVVARIMYYTDRTWTGKLSFEHFRAGDVAGAFRELDGESDMNRLVRFFSYDHFYVLYCKFWELDRDHDLLLSRDDLARHDACALSSRILDRLFDDRVHRLRSGRPGMFGFEDFIHFLLSDVDKSTPQAVEYWFRLCDLDGDGVLAIFELEHFYEEQAHRMEAFGYDVVFFDDLVCQIMDVVKPTNASKIYRADLKRCRNAAYLFDALFNLSRFIRSENKESAQARREMELENLNAWERYAKVEYMRMCAEETE